MEADTSNWRVILCLFLPFLVPVLIFHKHASDKVHSEGSELSGETPDTHRQMKSVMKDVEAVDVRGTHAREAIEDLQVEEAISGLSRQSKRELRLKKLRHQKHGFRTMRFCTALVLFYCAPISKFILNVISTLIFLTFFSYIVLVQLHPMQRVCQINGTHGFQPPPELEPYIGFPQPHGLEIYLFLWAFTFVAEEFRQFFSKQQPLIKKLGELSYWDKFDMIISILFVLCLVLRLTVPCQKFDWVRNAYALTLAFCFIRFMQFYYPNQSLGPKVVMIINMLNDVIFFVCILVVFMLAYGVAYFSLITDTTYNYVNKKFTFEKIMRGVFYVPYWQMYGELGLEDVDQGSTVGGSRNWLVLVLLAVFMLGTNVLLINLLIAMFGHTFEKVQSESNKYYAYIRHELIYEYYTRPVLPPPFICIAHILRLVGYLRRRCCSRGCGAARLHKRKYDDFTMELDVTQHQRLSAIEQRATDRYLSRCPVFEETATVCDAADTEGWNGASNHDAEESELAGKICDLEEKCAKMEEQLKSVAESNIKMLQILEHLGDK